MSSDVASSCKDFVRSLSMTKPRVHQSPKWTERSQMSRIHILERSQVVPVPRPEVFAFFADPRNLEAITPAFLHFSILPPVPASLDVESRIDYRLSLFGVPFHWRTRIAAWQPGVRFVDVQERGPYALWHHTAHLRGRGARYPRLGPRGVPAPARSARGGRAPDHGAANAGADLRPPPGAGLGPSRRAARIPARRLIASYPANGFRRRIVSSRSGPTETAMTSTPVSTSSRFT